jgi:hypothetical protein
LWPTPGSPTATRLAICKKIVVRHGGTITARSAPGEGATFVVTLPVHQPQGERPHELAAQQPVTILMADDDSDDRQMTKEAFEETHQLLPTAGALLAVIVPPCRTTCCRTT